MLGPVPLLCGCGKGFLVDHGPKRNGRFTREQSGLSSKSCCQYSVKCIQSVSITAVVAAEDREVRTETRVLLEKVPTFNNWHRKRGW